MLNVGVCYIVSCMNSCISSSTSYNFNWLPEDQTKSFFKSLLDGWITRLPLPPAICSAEVTEMDFPAHVQRWGKGRNGRCFDLHELNLLLQLSNQAEWRK